MFKSPRNPLLAKALVVGALALLMLIPLNMIEGLIAERAARRMEAVASVQASFAGRQTLVLPFFVWPYVEQWTDETVNASGRVIARTQHTSETRYLLWFAEQVGADAQVTVESDRYRGIHRVRTFDSKISISGSVIWPDREAVKPSADGRRLVWAEPRLVLPISDVRGLRGTPSLAVDGEPRTFKEATLLATMNSGIHAVLVAPSATASQRFLIALALAGTEQIAFAPTATNTVVTVQSAWPDPHFAGRYLPVDRIISAAGFTARWEVPALASAVQQQLRAAASSAVGDKRGVTAIDTFDVDFIEAVNAYLLAERSTKHGALIIVLVFAALFLFDTLRAVNAHAVQYGFVGLSLAIFFLLLLSLSEHIAFGFAYLIAGSACTMLITYYLRYVLHDTRRTAGFGAALALMYATVYAILVAEASALLMGSGLLFATLATAMIVTRKLDWRLFSPGTRAE
ncbi:MAG: cell envelope integrity protein CreD [Pseudomonadota bacterium]|nr:cell envelope integrity protein CreD [Pseudomonadota bacterium]